MNPPNEPAGRLLMNTAGGALLVILQISHTELEKTIVLASLGALVSYGISALLRNIELLLRKRR
jgi:hypothetical protein